MSDTWRVLYHPPYSGATNMAIDQAIMEAVGRAEVPPTLRFYAWEPACLSLGYAQRVREVDRDRLTAHGWELVRRPTGGKAILHTDELTYSVAILERDPIVQGGVIESYRRLSVALLRGLELLHVQAAITPREQAGKALGPVCFEVPSDYEVTAEGRKLIGSAQVRRHHTVLQHGTLPLHGDITRICDALVFVDETERRLARQRVAERATTIETAFGRQVSWQVMADALRDAFAETFHLQITDSELTLAEQTRAEALCATVYASDEWTLRL
jgi:lipoyl(octanoyl) transferase